MPKETRSAMESNSRPKAEEPLVSRAAMPSMPSRMAAMSTAQAAVSKSPLMTLMMA